MIIDTSALVAMALNEPDGRRCLERILRAPSRRISAANLLEAFMVIDGARDRVLSTKLDAIVADVRLLVEPVTEAHVRIAREAFGRYGKGSGHPARLNFGDCFAYALAHALDEPLLFIGNDFGHTDIEAAME